MWILGGFGYFGYFSEIPHMPHYSVASVLLLCRGDTVRDGSLLAGRARGYIVAVVV